MDKHSNIQRFVTDIENELHQERLVLDYLDSYTLIERMMAWITLPLVEQKASRQAMFDELCDFIEKAHDPYAE